MQTIEKWRRYELTMGGPKDGNPFRNVDLTATFEHNGNKITVDGFYDGEGIYKLRYMPQETGHFKVVTNSHVEA